MKTVAQCLAENIRRLRRERGLTQSELARQVGLSLSFLQNIEGAKKWVGPETLSALARALKVVETELFADPDRSPHPDAKAILAVLSAALGVDLPEETLRGLEARRPFSHYAKLYSLLPDDVHAELSQACSHPEWDWGAVRASIARFRKA